MTRPRVGSLVWQCLLETELLCHRSPVLVELFKFPDEIGQQISVCIDKPVELVPVRGRVHASCAAVLDPIDKLFEAHLVPELQRFCALIQRNDSVPRIADEPEFEIGFELFASGFFPAVFRHQQIESGEDSVFSSAVPGPGCFHQLFDLPQIQVRFPCFSENCSDAG